jgi:hypothetical protein
MGQSELREDMEARDIHPAARAVNLSHGNPDISSPGVILLNENCKGDSSDLSKGG